MAVTVTEAAAINSLIGWVTGGERSNGVSITEDEARRAANTLARSAHKRLSAGFTGNGDVDEAWKARR